MNKTTRPRGFAEWNPDQASLRLVDAINGVLYDYRDYLPLTLRQIFYRLVSAGILGKTEKDYKNQLIEKAGRARRAGLIPMDHIRDDGFTHNSIPTYTDANHVARVLMAIAKDSAVDRQAGQDRRIILWCEAGGMLPQLQRVGTPYGVEVASSGGFDSLTTKHDMAKLFTESQEPTLVLHIGDHDPSGVHMFTSLEEDVMAFVEHYSGDVEFERIAVTPEQVAKYNLPQAPRKATDNRSFNGLTTQAEALPPDVLASIMTVAIESRMDLDLYDEQLELEAEMQAEIVARLSA